MVSTLADLSMQLHELELKQDEVLRDLARYGAPEQNREAEYIEALVDMLFAILCYMAQDDEEELKRLTTAHKWFRDDFTSWRNKPGSRILYWKRGLSARLAYVLPPEIADTVPISVWDPWVEEIEIDADSGGQKEEDK